ERNQGHAPLSSWFPKPEHEGDIVLLEPSGAWTPGDVFALLDDPKGVEWRHKVGVAGRQDGSAKATTRLLLSGGWVCKTRTDQVFSSKGAALEWLYASRAPGRNAALWHPAKVWAVVRVTDAWRPLTLCPELVTLRHVAQMEERCLAWIDLIQVG